jgi:hypothetical protein
MTYISRGRTLAEVIVAVVVVCFLLGFVTVLCIGNFYRAKSAMERQRQRRLARLAGGGGNGVVGGFEYSPASHTSSMYSEEPERQSLLRSAPSDGMNQRNAKNYRGKANAEGTDSLLLDLNDKKPNVAMV